MAGSVGARIGIMLKSLDEAYQRAVFEGARERAEELGLGLVSLQGGDFEPGDGRPSPEPFGHLGLSGMLYLSSILVPNGDSTALKVINASFGSLPLVSIGCPMEGRSSVLARTEGAMRELAEHLVFHHGYLRILYLGGPLANNDNAVRERALKEAVATARIRGLDASLELMHGGIFSERAGGALMRERLERRPRRDIDVIASGSDEMAFGALRCLAERGGSEWASCPVTGFDDVPDADDPRVSLTTVRQPAREMGSAGVDLLAELLGSREVGQAVRSLPRTVTLEARFVRRSSCGCPSNGGASHFVPPLEPAFERSEARMGSFGQSLLLAEREEDIAEALAELIEGMGLRRCALISYGQGGGARLLLDKGPGGFAASASPAPASAFDARAYFSHAWGDEPSFHSYSLRSGSERLGVLAYSCGDAELGPMSACGAFLSLGLKRLHQLMAEAERARSLEVLAEARGRELAREARKRRAVEAEVLKIGDLERARIGLELHDDLCQRLAGLAMLASCASAPPGRLERIRLIAEDALERARRYAHDAYPMDLEGIDLETALMRLCERSLEGHPGISFSGSLGGRRPSPLVKLNVYRIAQEALSNALRHAGASNIRLSIVTRGKGFRLVIHDDGSGGAMRKGHGGLGFRSMRYRADQIGARLVIRSPEGGGTSVVLDAPLKEEGYGAED